MQRNPVICKVVAKECRELTLGGFTPSLNRLSATVYRLGDISEVKDAFERWEQSQTPQRRAS